MDKEYEKAVNEQWRIDHIKKRSPRGILAFISYISQEIDKAERERMKSKRELREKFLSLEERRQLSDTANLISEV